MGTSYTATIQLRCWKEHTCVGCNAAYGYLFARTIKGQAGSTAAANAAAEKAVAKAIAREVDMHPCPTCGLYQPDMIGARCARRHWYLFWFTLVAFLLLLFLYAIEVVHPGTAGYRAALVCLAAAIGHRAACRPNPNTDLEANRALAAQRIQAGKLQQRNAGKSESPEPEYTVSPFTIDRRLAVASLVAAALLALAPEMVRSVSDWPLNPECYPPVVGPGDETKVYFREKLTSVKGYWRGRPTVVAAMPGGDSFEVQALTKDNNWGNSISAKSSEKNSSSTVWVRVLIPPRPDLIGKRLQLNFTLDVEFPQMNAGANTFSVMGGRLTHQTSLEVAPAGSGAEYRGMWWSCILVSAALAFVSSGYLIYQAYALRRQAPPTQVYS